MSEEESSIFGSTGRFQRAMALINGIESKFALFLGKVLEGLHKPKERTFSDEEEEQLVGLLGLDTIGDLDTVVDACSFIFQQSAFLGLKPAKLEAHLKLTELAGDKVDVFVQLWAEEGPEYVNKLRDKSLGGLPTLESVDWQLKLEMSQDTLTRINEPNAVFQFGTSQETANGEVVKDSFVVEMDHKALSKLFGDLERLQDQLDAMG